ncbi:MAG: microcompartment protein [Myxococcales bacterium]|nr:microcompartment protein [Myxococcales bacterium]
MRLEAILRRMELRALTFLDVLQPQVAGFLQTVAQGYMPLDGQSALIVEIAPGIAINALTDAALKGTRVVPGMQIVERAYGMLELHAADQGEVRQAARAILERLGVGETDRLAPRVLSREIITGIDGHQSAMINRMRHGDMLRAGQSLYTLEVQPAGYAAIAANEAEKRAEIAVLELVTFGAVGRLWLGGDEEEIQQAARAVDEVLAGLVGRAPGGGTKK